jgi:hypothetical protein
MASTFDETKLFFHTAAAVFLNLNQSRRLLTCFWSTVDQTHAEPRIDDTGWGKTPKSEY